VNRRYFGFASFGIGIVIYTKREIIAIACGLLVAAAMTVWVTIYFIKVFFIGERDDPLARAGGLKPVQTIQSK
jgi:hypothetical protein